MSVEQVRTCTALVKRKQPVRVRPPALGLCAGAQRCLASNARGVQLPDSPQRPQRTHARVAQLVGGSWLRTSAVHVRIVFRVRNSSADVAQWSERSPVERDAEGSIPFAGAHMERWPSGLWRCFAKAERLCPSRVRIPASPPVPSRPKWLGRLADNEETEGSTPSDGTMPLYLSGSEDLITNQGVASSNLARGTK